MRSGSPSTWLSASSTGNSASVRPHPRKLESLPEEPFFAGLYESLESVFVQDLERRRNDQFGEGAPKRFVDTE